MFMKLKQWNSALRVKGMSTNTYTRPHLSRFATMRQPCSMWPPFMGSSMKGPTLRIGSPATAKCTRKLITSRQSTFPPSTRHGLTEGNTLSNSLTNRKLNTTRHIIYRVMVKFTKHPVNPPRLHTGRCPLVTPCRWCSLWKRPTVETTPRGRQATRR